MNSLKAARVQRTNLSTRTAAFLLGMNQGLLEQYEEGKARYDLEEAKKFAAFYGVPVESLIKIKKVEHD